MTKDQYQTREYITDNVTVAELPNCSTVLGTIKYIEHLLQARNP